MFKDQIENKKKKNSNILAYVTPGLPMSVHKKIQPIWSSRLAGQREHIHECLVLLDNYISNKLSFFVLKVKIEF